MKEDLIGRIRSMLDFIEEYDTLMNEAIRTGDEEREADLAASLCSAEHNLKESVLQLIGEEPEWKNPDAGKIPF